MGDATHDDDDNAPPRPRIPRAAFICGLAALAFTTGITVACIPALRRRQQGAGTKAGIQFLSNRGLMRPAPPPRRSPAGARISGVVSVSGNGSSSTPTSAVPKGTTPLKVEQQVHILDDPSPSLSPLHPPETDHGPGTGAISPLFALGAFGIATGIVLATAGATAVAISKILDVRDMEEFSAKMREYTGTLLPSMSNRLYNPTPHVDHAESDEDELDPTRGHDEEDSLVRGWLGGVVREIEDDRRRVVVERGLGESERVV